MGTTLNIVVADDHPLMRAGVKTALTSQEGYQVVGETRDGPETLRVVGETQPDLLLLDLEMPACEPEHLIKQLLTLQPDLKILIVSAHNDPGLLRRLANARVCGYLLKQEAPEDLLQAVRIVSTGGTWFSQSIAQSLMNLHQSQADDVTARLTDRECQLLHHLCRGSDNATIAEAMSLSEQTVRNYTSTVYSKLGVNTRVAAAVIGLQHHDNLTRRLGQN